MGKINNKKLKVMIVEDEEDILLLYEDFLSAKGHGVTTYLTGDDMVKEIDNEGSEIYLIGYRLPGNENGIHVAIEILNKFPSAPILFITAYEHLHKEISKNPVFYNKNIHVLLKPVKLDKVENALVSLVNRN
jgi:DNA-binding NtrC family response regulator